jgi:hypothetical protein
MTRAWVKKFAIGVAALSAALVVSVLILVPYGYSKNEQGLRKGLDVLLRERLGVHYKIERESLEPDGFDPAGDWWIVLENVPPDFRAKLAASGFGENAESDRSYNVFAARTQFGYATVPDGERSFESELTLGDESCCAREGFGCNVLILFRDGDPNVFVRIWKT